METATDLLDEYDLSISVDCGSADRLGLAQTLFTQAKISVNIDHHVSNERFGTLNIVEVSASASGEVVYDLLQELKIPLDANIATCLYTAIVSDTGGFKYSNTTAKVLEISARLVSAGANPEYVFKQLYEERPLEQLMMQADAILHAQYNADRTIGWTIVDQALLDKHGALEEHVDGLVESIRRVDTVLVAFVLKETTSGQTKVSVRSDTHDIDVSEVMCQFGGGGHRMAAGCTIDKAPDEALKVLLPIFEDKVRNRMLIR